MKRFNLFIASALLWPVTSLAAQTDHLSNRPTQDHHPSIAPLLIQPLSENNTDASQQSTLMSDQVDVLHPQADCTPNPDAQRVGIYHFAFDEAKWADLVVVNRYRVHKIAAPSLRKMMAAAKADGAPLTIASGFRSVRYQQDLINRKIKSKQSPVQIYRLSAPAGYSEHHTGLAVDFSPIDDSFVKTKGYTWLLENAHHYGWYQTYTEAYSKVSGVAEESWHWKYRGDDVAAQMLKNDACLLPDLG